MVAVDQQEIVAVAADLLGLTLLPPPGEWGSSLELERRACLSEPARPERAVRMIAGFRSRRAVSP